MALGEAHRSIPAMVQVSAERWAGREAIVDGEVRLSFADVQRDMAAVARSLIAMGVKPGDRIGVWAPNSAGWIPAALGILAAGAWLVPLNTRLKGDEAAYILGKTDARAVFMPRSFLGTDYAAMLRSAAPDLRSLQSVVGLPEPGRYGGADWDEFLAGGKGVSADEVQRRIDAIHPEDVSDVIFTSGTTGYPKGVMLRHGTSLRGYGMLNDDWRLGEGDHHMVSAPFFHCFGYKAGWMLNLLTGATTLPIAVFDAETAMRTIERERVTHMPGPPTMFFAMLDHPDRGKYDLSTLRCAIVSAASIPAELIHRMRDELKIEAVLTGYGLTENHALVSCSSPDDDPDTVATTAGRILPGLEIRIIDEEGRDLPYGEQEEILVRGFLQMTGYYGDPEATARTIVDGWLHTGDIGTINEQGYIRITDRKKDMFIVGGFNVAPAEVERTLLEVDGVAQVAVVGMPDDYLGEVAAAFVLRQPGASVTTSDIEAYAKAHLANYKVPRKVIFVDAFPLNATGKVLKTGLRKQLAAAS